MFAYCKVPLYYGTLGWGQSSADPSTIKIVSHKTNAAQNSIFNDHCLPAAYNQEPVQTGVRKSETI